jgi:hypothetical protein
VAIELVGDIVLFIAEKKEPPQGGYFEVYRRKAESFT